MPCNTWELYPRYWSWMHYIYFFTQFAGNFESKITFCFTLYSFSIVVSNSEHYQSNIITLYFSERCDNIVKLWKLIPCIFLSYVSTKSINIYTHWYILKQNSLTCLFTSDRKVITVSWFVSDGFTSAEKNATFVKINKNFLKNI